jgi:hypothetical protein
LNQNESTISLPAIAFIICPVCSKYRPVRANDYSTIVLSQSTITQYNQADRKARFPCYLLRIRTLPSVLNIETVPNETGTKQEEASAVMGGCPEKDFKTPQPSTFKQHWIHAL